MVFGLMTVIGVTGNSLVIYVIVKHGHMKTATNLYIVSLAITDISFLICCAPFTATTFYSHLWLFGRILCKFVFMMMQVAATATCLTLAAMSVDRYRAIVRPLQSLRSRTIQVALGVNIGIWTDFCHFLFTVSFVTSIPAAFYFDLDGNVCVEVWPSLKAAYGLYMAFALYVFPLTVISACYALMLNKLWRMVLPGDVLNGQNQQHLQQKRRTTRMVMVVVVTFAVCWLPVYVFNLWYRLNEKRFPVNNGMYIFRVVSHILSYGNSCCNPFIYAFMGENFRKHFKKAFPRCFAKNRPRVSSPGRTAATGGC
ncbi:G-protein coupled receptor 54 [Holothuria leucospilota]|uniref:G-protein coupled receptor 54 n=1 Tax=Holothuria leucospilota TaxID=206669 RepID=A0A9Q0YLI0_HOLLE|nr:G-protein coupled receptor 54 [Holothuria leucospilota]